MATIIETPPNAIVNVTNKVDSKDFLILGIFLMFITLNLGADKNWIPIKPINKTSKQSLKVDFNLSLFKPLNNMIKNASVIRKLINIQKKEKSSTIKDKKWYEIKNQ